MALIECRHCGRLVSDRAEFCPECGNPTEYSVNTTNKTNCPNCGAPLTNSVACEYCGTVFPRPQINTAANRQNDGLEAGLAAFLGGVVGGIISN